MSQLPSPILTPSQFPHTNHNRQHKETLIFFLTSQPHSSEPLRLPLSILNTAATFPFLSHPPSLLLQEHHWPTIVAARTASLECPSFHCCRQNTPLLECSSFRYYRQGAWLLECSSFPCCMNTIVAEHLCCHLETPLPLTALQSYRCA